MKKGTFTRAEFIMGKIKEYKKHLSKLEYGSDSVEIVFYRPANKELNNLLIEFFNNKINELEKEFEDL